MQKENDLLKWDKLEEPNIVENDLEVAPEPAWSSL